MACVIIGQYEQQTTELLSQRGYYRVSQKFFKKQLQIFFHSEVPCSYFFFKEQGGRSLQADGELVPGNTAN